MRIKIILLFIMLLTLLFQNCVDSVPVKFFNSRVSLKSEITGGGGGYEGKPESGHYCRVFDDISCQPQVQNLQGLVKVDNSAIHLLQDNCTSSSINFQIGDSAVEFSSLAKDFLGVSRGIFKKCEMGSDNLPAPSREMTDAYCVSHQDNMTVIVNKNLSNNNFTFDLFFKNNSQSHEVLGVSVNKSKTSFSDSYTSSSQEFNLEISSNNAQTAKGHLQVVVDDKLLSIDLNCRTASAAPTVIIKEDLEISPTWIDTTSLVGYWKLNEVNAGNGAIIADSSKYAAHGTLNTDNGALVKSDASVVGGSLFFDGLNDSVDIPQPMNSHLSFDMRSFTYMVWIKKTGNAGNFDIPIYRGGSSAAFAGFCITCGSADCRAAISDGTRNPPASTQMATFRTGGSTTTALFGRWVLLTAVVDREKKQLRSYLDGVLITTADISQVGSVSSDYNLEFGSSYINTRNNFFWGSIDDVSIWNKALSEQEIKEIFQRLRPKFY